jgi:DNA-binding NarL/FixJ family response regulator
LLDVHLGDDDGFALCGSLTRSHPGLAVLLASIHDPEDPESITRCGARGFVRKTHLARVDFGIFWPRGVASSEAAAS